MQIGQELLQASIVLQLFGLGLRGLSSELAMLPHEPPKIGRIVVVRDLLVPVVVMSVLSLLGAPRPAIMGATMLAISPGALLLPQGMLGPRSEMVFGTSVLDALGSILTVPFWLATMCWLFVSDASVAPAAVAQLAGILCLLPLGLGAIVRRCGPELMRIASGPVIIAADLLLWLALVPLLDDTRYALPQLGDAFVLAVTCAPSIIVVVGVLVWPSTSSEYGCPAYVCTTRHPGLALLIAGSNFAGETVLPAVVVSFSGALAASMLYTVLTRYSHPRLSSATQPAIALARDESSAPTAPQAR